MDEYLPTDLLVRGHLSVPVSTHFSSLVHESLLLYRSLKAYEQAFT